MLIAGAAGAAAVAKLYWHRVKSLFSRDTPDTNDKPADGKDAEPPT